jgi:hypothetical protein
MWRDDYENDFRGYGGRGYGRGYGMGYGRGYGRGMGRGYGMGYGRGYGYENEGYYRPPTIEDEIRELNDYKRYLQDELSFVEERLQQLNKENGGE